MISMSLSSEVLGIELLIVGMNAMNASRSVAIMPSFLPRIFYWKKTRRLILPKIHMGTKI